MGARGGGAEALDVAQQAERRHQHRRRDHRPRDAQVVALEVDGGAVGEMVARDQPLPDVRDKRDERGVIEGLAERLVDIDRRTPTGWSGTLSSHCISVGDSPAICAGNHSESSGAACDEMTCRLAMLPVKLNRITIHWTHWRAPSPNITSTSSWYDPASCCRAQPAMTVRLYAQRTDVPMHIAAPSAKPACWKACGGERGA